MAKIEDCPGFETFGADVKAARKAKQLSRSALADMIHCDSRYLANVENEGTLPSLPVVIQLIIAIFNNTAASTLTFEKKWYNRNKEGECYAAQRSSKVDSGRIR